ncbi:GntP family transporter [Pseudoclavibacter sp. RFBJ3]|uniref:GntP family transporter n=1 Tax=unclassified Pseudoclavibacter TaxID=2615177 RepID=UPI000CE726A3|nr:MULTISPECIES: GntP family transporter [unclassified Pseudoclavibacter]PPF81433.1 GntP family transporter [Pseudoclavibacter sp. RFBJ5]PPF90764.1 GntP family transporter [Pseudoclavibacter sp. RFBJ3]PPG00605.1 GntP family transporter [Pseudoclavibacter sp. RFBH5]PPG21060.1 GntP family transporter [Pseudoclavibacter sp. RFBI4]
MSTFLLLAIAAGGIGLLLLLIIKLKVHAFLALLIVSVLLGLATGLPLVTVPETELEPARVGIIESIIAGMGGVLGSVAILVALGAMLGKIIEISGGASSLAGRFTKLLGPKRVAGALTAAALVLAIPVFFDVGFIILVPIIYGFCKAAGVDPVKFGLPIGGIMLAVHVAMPPHPGIVGGAGILGADLGWVTMIGLPICLLLAVVSHFFSKWLNRKNFTMLPATAKSFAEFGTEKATAIVADAEGASGSESGASGASGTATKARTVAPPSAGMVMALIVTPLIMIALGTVGATLLPVGDPIRNVLAFIGAPLFALLVTVLLASFFLGIRRGWSASQLGDVVEAALPPVAVVLLVTGGGGAFARVLTESGIGTALSETLLATGMPLMIMAYLISLALRAAQGSATVAILTTAGLLSASILGGGYSTIQVALLALAIAFGALGLSHVNDSGFWVVTRYLGLGVADGLRTWTVLTTVLGLVGFLLCFVVWLLVGVA